MFSRYVVSSCALDKIALLAFQYTAYFYNNALIKAPQIFNHAHAFAENYEKDVLNDFTRRCMVSRWKKLDFFFF